MIYYKGEAIKTKIEELDEKEQLILIRGIYREFVEMNFMKWTRMIDRGKYGTPKCDQLWHETCRYMDIVEFCDNELKKFSEQK